MISLTTVGVRLSRVVKASDDYSDETGVPVHQCNLKQHCMFSSGSLGCSGQISTQSREKRSDWQGLEDTYREPQKCWNLAQRGKLQTFLTWIEFGLQFNGFHKVQQINRTLILSRKTMTWPMKSSGFFFFFLFFFFWGGVCFWRNCQLTYPDVMLDGMRIGSLKANIWLNGVKFATLPFNL